MRAPDMTTDVKIAKWGNSLALRLPSAVAKRHGMREGATVTLDDDGKVVSLRTKRRPTLQELAAQITPKNRVPAVKFGPPVGKEVW